MRDRDQVGKPSAGIHSNTIPQSQHEGDGMSTVSFQMYAEVLHIVKMEVNSICDWLQFTGVTVGP